MSPLFHNKSPQAQPADASAAACTGMQAGLVGIDLGGTKCAVSVRDANAASEASASDAGGAKAAGSANAANGVREIARFPSGAPDMVLARIFEEIDRLAPSQRVAFGISCGGPLDAARGLILSPPNLPGWNRVAICDALTQRYGGRARLMNDANACALAEWRHGAGRGCNDMVFLTMGTGMGAGLILDGRLHEGVCGDAGEVGHMRLARSGPVGFGKAGSFEGFCSGGGIAQLARERLAAWTGDSLLRAVENAQPTARDVGLAAEKGDVLALKIWSEVGTRLGEALAVMVDLLNPARIVIGGIFPRSERFIAPSMMDVLQAEALGPSVAACRVVPAALGEQIGSHAALEVARFALDENLSSTAPQS